MRAVHCGYMIDPERAAGSSSGSSSYNNPVDEKIQQSMRSYEKKSTDHNDNSSSSNITNEQDGLHRFLLAPTVYKYVECNDFYSSHWVWALAVASLVFLIFTCAMGIEQLDAIETGKGKIARMKMSVGSTGTEFSRVTEEFNEMFGGETGPQVALHWFFPWRPVTFPRSMKKVVLGYEWDESLPDDEPFYYPDDNGNARIANGVNRSVSTTAIDALGDREMLELEGGRLQPPLPSSTTLTQMMMPPIISNGSLLSQNGLDNYNLDNVPTVPSTSRDNSKDALLMRHDASNVATTAAALDDDCARGFNNGVIVESSNKNTTPTVVLSAAPSTEGIGESTHSLSFGIKNRIAAQKTNSGSVGGGGSTLVERTMTRIT
jgi:hypothetical protein